MTDTTHMKYVPGKGNSPIRKPPTGLETFDDSQGRIVTQAVQVSEELVSNHYKMTAGQWLKGRYDVKTLAALTPHEIVQGPYAQIVRYLGHRSKTGLSSNSFDFYKICLMDFTILGTLREKPDLQLYPFMLYVLTHELIHIVRFLKFLQTFDASEAEKLEEEERVHAGTRDILHQISIPGLSAILDYYQRWANLSKSNQKKP